ncbi:MAG: glycosyltransferase family 4 protein [Myxococcaceae bacterium]
MSEQPRLLFCTFDVVPSPSGASRRLTSLIRAASKHYQVVVLSTKTPDHSHIEKYAGARLLRVPVGSGDHASQVDTFDRAVRRQVDSEEYAVAHFTDPFGGYGLCEVAGKARFKLVYDAISFPSMEAPGDSDLTVLARLRRRELFCLMNAQRVVTGSELTRRYIEKLGVSGDQIRVLRTAAQLSEYPLAQRTLPNRTPMRALYLGSYLPWQGMPTLLEAMARARGQARLTIVGPVRPDLLRKLIAEHQIEDVVELRDPVAADALPALWAEHDLCVAPLADCARNRMQGGAGAEISEALGAGRPILASDLPLCRELCPEDASRFFPVGDAEALAKQLVELATQPALRETMGAAGRAHAEQWLAPAAQSAALLRLYAELLGGDRSANGEEPDFAPLTATPTLRIVPRDQAATDPALTIPGFRFPTAAPPPLRRPMRPDLPEAWGRQSGSTGEHVVPRAPTLEPLDDVQDEIISSEGLMEGTDAPEPVALTDGKLDPWLAQLVWGYCPPEGTHFARHTPPTNFPGRDDPPPETVES